MNPQRVPRGKNEGDEGDEYGDADSLLSFSDDGSTKSVEKMELCKLMQKITGMKIVLSVS